MNNDVLSVNFGEARANIEQIKTIVSQIERSLETMSQDTTRLISGGGWSGEDANIYQTQERGFVELVKEKVGKIDQSASVLLNELEMDQQTASNAESMIEDLKGI